MVATCAKIGDYYKFISLVTAANPQNCTTTKQSPCMSKIPYQHQLSVIDSFSCYSIFGKKNEKKLFTFLNVL